MRTFFLITLILLTTPLTHAEQITSAIRSLDLKNNRLEIWPRGHCERTEFDFPKSMRKELKTFYNLKLELTIECKNPLTSYIFGKSKNQPHMELSDLAKASPELEKLVHKIQQARAKGESYTVGKIPQEMLKKLPKEK